MNYDIFISYSRRDNERGQVAALEAQIETSFRDFAGRELRVFFDTHQIQGMDDWRQKIQRSLRESHLFLAVLSPNYLASPYCRWEWEDYVRYEAMRQCLGEGVAPVFFVTLPDAATPQADQAIARWIDEINHRQAFDLRPWHDRGEQALHEAHVRATLDQLHTAVRDRLDRAERARRSPNNLIKHNPAFVGRVQELTALRNALAKNKLGVVGARQGQVPGRATVQGLGGMGKTELALAYAHAFAWDYPGGRWQVRCEHISDLRLALLQLAAPLGVEFPDDEKKDLARAFDRILRELNRRERSLIILDNVSDPNILQPEHLDRLPRDGRVDIIATTRLAPASIPGSAQDQTFIAVDELPEDDALALMRSHQLQGRFASPAEDDEVRRIVRLLHGFTLAVETAAIYLGRHPSQDACRQFRERLSPDLLRESENAATDPAVAVRHRVRSLKETLAFTLQTLTPEARHLLDCASFLPADQIAVPWLKTLGAAEFPAFNAEAENARDLFRQTLDLLLGQRLFQTTEVMDADGRPLVVRMHRLVQELVANREQVDATAGSPTPELKLQIIAHARTRARFLEKSWPDLVNRWEIEPLRGISEKLLAENDPEAPLLAAHAGLRLLDLARFSEGEPLMRWALEIDEKNLGANHTDVARDLSNLALLLQATNRLSEAEPLMRRALGIDERTFGSDHPQVARSLNNLAGLLKDANRLAEAEPLFRRGLAIDEQSLGPDHPDVARDLNNLALLLQVTNRLAEAEPLMRRALTISEQSFGPDHPTVAIRLNNLVGVLQATNRLAEAEPLMRQALAIDEESFGPDHPNVATDLNNLAQLLQATNRLTEAELLMRRALSIDQQSLGPDHPDVARDLSNLALLLQATNRLAEAEELVLRAVAIDEKSLGPDHPSVATRLNNRAALLRATNRVAEAEPLMWRALAIDERSFGPDHPTVARDLSNLAAVFQASNRLAEAEPLMRRALAIGEQSHGPDHPDVAIRLNNLAQLLQATNRLSETEPLMRRALAIDEKSFGPNHPAVARDLGNLAGLLRTTNRSSEAEPLIRRALAIDEKSFGPNHPAVAKCLNNLAGLLKATNRLAEAETLYRRALAIAEGSLGPQHPDVAEILNNVAALLYATNRFREAELLLRRALDIWERSLGSSHPDVATALNNLAHLLKATNRLVEAEPLMLRVVEIFLKFTVDTGHQHPHLRDAIGSYAGVLQRIGRSPQQIQAQLNAVARPFGMRFGG